MHETKKIIFRWKVYIKLLFLLYFFNISIFLQNTWLTLIAYTSTDVQIMNFEHFFHLKILVIS